MDWGAISLIIFLAAIAFSFWKKTNLGILCLGLAVVVGHLAGMKDAEIYKGLNLNVFFNLVGVFALGAVLTSNGSLKLLSQKILSKVKASARLYPWVAFIFAAVFMAFSPGSGVSFTVVPFITMSMAVVVGCPVLPTGIITTLGTLSTFGAVMPMSGIQGRAILEGAGYQGLAWPLFTAIFISCFLGAVFVYFFTGCHKKGNSVMLGGADAPKEELPKFTKQQIISLVGLLVFIVLYLTTNWHAGLLACLFVTVLIVLGCASEKEVFKGIPWGTIMTVAGAGIYMSVCVALGGVDVLSKVILTLTSKITVTPIYHFVAGFLSWFTYALSVPIPTLTPTVHAVMEGLGLGMVREIETVTAIQAGAYLATISPLSLAGASVLSAYTTIKKSDEKETSQAFNKMLLIAVVTTIVVSILIGFGFNRLFIKG